METIFHVQLST